METIREKSIMLKKRVDPLIVSVKKIEMSNIQAGLDSIFAAVAPIKPFTTVRLIRNMIDAEGFEHFIYSVICMLELHSNVLPQKEEISDEAMEQMFKYMEWYRMTKEKVETSPTEELEPQAFMKVGETNESLAKLCDNFGLKLATVESTFKEMQLPIIILSGMLGLAGIMCGDKAIKFLVEPKEFHAKIARSAKMIKDCSTNMDFFEKHVGSLLDFIGSFFGMKWLSEKDHKSRAVMDKIAEMRDKFTTLTSKTQTSLSEIVQSEVGVKELEKDIKFLENEIESLIRSNVNVGLYSSYLVGFQRQIPVLRKIVNNTMNSQAGKQQPALLYLGGGARLGKSKFAQYIISQLGELEGRVLSVYTRNSAGDKFWPGYVHQDVVLYDDFGQDQQNVDHTELIGIYTSASYRVNMSDNDEKGRPFTSKYVIMCSNQNYISSSKAVNDLNALSGRRDFHYRVRAPGVLEYIDIHGHPPPSDSDIWKPDFSHLCVDEMRAIPAAHTAVPNVIKEDCGNTHIARELYEQQLIRKTEYEQALQDAIIAADTMRQIENNENFEDPNVQIDVENEVVRMVPQSIQRTVTGNNRFLLLGPSGCGKSHLMKNMNCTKIFSIHDVINQDGTLKIPTNANLHFEDISITENVTNNAIEVCQYLSDNNQFEGNIVFTANPRMLIKNLQARGEEALEVFYRRCKVVQIRCFTNIATTVYKMNATKLQSQTKYTWDNIYYGQYEEEGKTSNLNLAEIQLLLAKQERTIIVRAICDSEAIHDFKNSKPQILNLPDLTFHEFSNMGDRKDMIGYLSTGSMLRCIKTLTAYEPALSMLPRSACSPVQLINMVNQQQIRLPQTLPSVQLKCADFSVDIINHQTYLLMHISTPNEDIPPLDVPFIAEPEVCEVRTSWLQMACQLIKLVAGGVLLTRELFGVNRKHTKNLHKALKVAEIRLNTPPTPQLENEGQCDCKRESKQSRKRAQHNRVARSQLQEKVNLDDKDYDKKKYNWRTGELMNEAKRHILKYDMEPKGESKIKTHTDFGPRQEMPQYISEFTVDINSKYHPHQYAHIKNEHESKGLTHMNVYMTDYLESNKLDRTFLTNHLTFQNLTITEQDYWTAYFSQYNASYLIPEAMHDQQAAQLVPILERNQVFIYDGETMVQRALMVYDRVGVTTAHGIGEESTIMVPRTGQKFSIKIIQKNIEKDLAIFSVQKQCQSFADIRKFIRSKDDVEPLDGVDAFFLTVHKMKDSVVSQIRVSKVEMRKEVRYDNRIRDGFFYAGTITGFDLPLPSLTEKGHCGAPGVILNTRYARKIISIHSAGSAHCSFGLPIYKEMFYDNLENQSMQLDHIEVKPYNALKTIDPFMIGEFKVRYELEHNNSQPVKTDIFRSPLQSDMYGDNFEPAILAGYDTRNIDQADLQHVTIEKWSHAQPTKMNKETVDYVTEEWSKYFANIVRKNNFKQFVLTKTEAINRTTYYESSQPINKDTSAGYPWKNRLGSIGKKLFIESRPHKNAILNCIKDDQNGRDMHHAVDSLIQTCKEGKRPAVVFSCGAKDEVIKKTKIYPCRTRGFAGSPLEYYLAHRMYFHTAVCALIESRKETPIKLGIEANGQEWNNLWQWLASNSTVGCDLDFKDWDAKIPRYLMEQLHKIYNAIYSANPRKEDIESLQEDNKIRTMLYTALHGPLLTMGQYVVQSPGGQVSGQPCTTPDNCLVGLIKIAYAYIELAKIHAPQLATFTEFLNLVRVAVFGDDQMMTIKPDILDWFNFRTIQAKLTEDMGVDITQAAKDGKTIDFKDLKDMEFLKRDFLKIGPYYYGKIQKTAIDKMLNWTHTHRKHHYFKEPHRIHYDLLTIHASLDSLLFELCIYPPEEYNRVIDHCQSVLRDIGSRKILPSQRDTLIQRGIPHKLFLSQYDI